MILERWVKDLQGLIASLKALVVGRRTSIDCLHNFTVFSALDFEFVLCLVQIADQR